ncbi:myosin light chain [Brachionus plicatilis]|uniref:Myosin light chain n=1 Tax=Brachionus plicatilis TaxID=10195 RepID=A0A3M7S8K1_BRAPC|nr:myosin light chain [Brachionus plicatilis]
MASLPQDKVDEAKQVFEVFDKKYESKKTWGTYEDFMEGLKLYDKESNGLLSLAELSQVLVAMAEKLTPDQLEEIMKCTDTKEDGDGMINYDVFVRKVIAGPFPQD